MIIACSSYIYGISETYCIICGMLRLKTWYIRTSIVCNIYLLMLYLPIQAMFSLWLQPSVTGSKYIVGGHESSTYILLTTLRNLLQSIGCGMSVAFTGTEGMSKLNKYKQFTYWQ